MAGNFRRAMARPISLGLPILTICAEVDINEANTARSERWLHWYRMPTQISDSTRLFGQSLSKSEQPFPEKAYIDMVSVVHDLAAVSSAKLERSGERLH